ncbi:hypothetical protein CAPTEDRAFT_192172 [Capitella teleta]|uniref:Uncharacterized protein n=1 Tax=Capitella teleta TaxID=283909 RepID=R7TEE2_CAPTE|nr:hypothetical protein CAPTEDRAFT_192172 [Capitella teleta]|eukprot:ELT89431.1 hypothetical protein CAPTEDRAFT_192172 [Capitella teleta]
MAPSGIRTTNDPLNGTAEVTSPWKSDEFSDAMTTESPLLSNQTDGTAAPEQTGLWQDPMVRYFGITGILALLCIVLLVVHIYISLLESKRERMADMKGPGPSMGVMAKGVGVGGGLSGSKPAPGKKGFQGNRGVAQHASKRC